MSMRKVAIVTGAAGGIGEAIARRFGEEGVAVLGTGRTEAALADLKARLEGEMEFDYAVADLAADAGPAAVVARAMERFGRIDFVVNNAGSFNIGPVDATTDAMLDEVLGISLRAPFRLCREALAHMGADGTGGAVIFIGSTWTREMRNGMAMSLLVFGAALFLLVPALENHGLWLSFCLFMVARALTLGAVYPRLERAVGQ